LPAECDRNWRHQRAPTGAPTANRLRAILSACFGWAMREGLCEANPVAATNKRAQPGRDRVLAMPELVDIWRALPDDGATVFAHACRLGAEGIVSKRVDGTYQSGPCHVWIKVRNPASIAVQRERSERWNR
jgi:hypothetical protein